MAKSIPPGGVSVPGPLPEKPLVGTSSAITGVVGQSNHGVGVWGQSLGDIGVGGNPGTDGVRGDGKNGVHGWSVSPTDSGVWGENTGAGYGVSGSTNSIFQPGPNVTAGVWGSNSGSGAGIKGTSSGGDGVLGYSSSSFHAGVSAVNDGHGFGVWASGTPAGHFDGDVTINGNLTCSGDVQLLVPNQDCAEDFEISGVDEISPGSVVVIDSVGALKQSHKAYDKRVAGVISGARDCRPGIVLGRLQVRDNRMPVALVGKVYCKVDAGYSPVEVGDLLTTSPTPGHAMKADDPVKAFGAVIGKALDSLKAGQTLIPILVALQ